MESVRPAFLKFMAQAMMITTFRGMEEARKLLHPFANDRFRAVTGPFDLPDHVIPVSFVDDEGRAGTHASDAPVSLHAHLRMGVGTAYQPFLLVRVHTSRRWFDLFLLRELEGLSLTRARLRRRSQTEGATTDAFRPFRDDAFYRDEVMKHRFAAAILETVFPGQLASSIGRLRNLQSSERELAARTAAADFCGSLEGPWQPERVAEIPHNIAFVADALCAETETIDRFAAHLRERARIAAKTAS